MGSRCHFPIYSANRIGSSKRKISKSFGHRSCSTSLERSAMGAKPIQPQTEQRTGPNYRRVFSNHPKGSRSYIASYVRFTLSSAKPTMEVFATFAGCLSYANWIGSLPHPIAPSRKLLPTLRLPSRSSAKKNNLGWPRICRIARSLSARTKRSILRFA